MLAFSTCWSSSRHSDGEVLVQEILEMGFDTIEVSHGLKVSLLPGILKKYRDGEVKVSGVHNFCPSPVEIMIDAPDAYEFTSHRRFERERALTLTRRTFKTAAEFGARYVVLHLGSIPMAPVTGTLEKLAATDGLASRRFAGRKLAAVRKRERLGPLYLPRAREALQTIAGWAEEAGVVAAVESRSHYEQVPTEREMVTLMDHFKDNPWVGYWHDFGHVQRKANLGLLDHGQWLERIAPHLVGCHLHDVIWPARDHRVPFQGSLDFGRLLARVPPGAPVVWELSPSRKRSDIVAARDTWAERFPETLTCDSRAA